MERVFARYQAQVKPRLPRLRAAVIHHDANDNNIIVDAADAGKVTGLIDFGDMLFGRQINELAVTLAYALLDMPDAIAAARPLIRGYHAEFPLTEDELAVLFDLVAMRLAMSVCISSRRAKQYPDNEYLLISQKPAFEMLRRLDGMNPHFLHFAAREAAGLTPVPAHDAVVAWLKSPACKPVSVLPFDIDRAARVVISLQAGAPGMEHAADPHAYWNWLKGKMAVEGALYALGLYGEDRNCYAGEQFKTDAPEMRSVHTGIDLFIEAETSLHAPLPGRVVSVVDNAIAFDYGPTVILEHRAGADGPAFYTLYGHLSRRTLETVAAGQTVEAGQVIGYIGDPSVNGNWAPHVHVQIMTDLMGKSGNFEGAGEPSRWPVWSSICPDTNLLLRLDEATFRADPAPPDVLLKKRADLLGPSLSISYRKKLKIVRGRGAYLYDHTGRAYLDCVNNICHVGHCHPKVVEALSTQAAILNTNTRYLHDTILAYAERIAATMPEPLRVVYFVCSGSEANELALRLARTATGRKDIISVDWGYHGNTQNLVDISPYKFNRKGGAGKPEHVHIADIPDPYRGPHKGYGEAAGRAYAQSVAERIADVRARTGTGPAAFIAESISGCGGQIVFPDGYLRHAFESRARGGRPLHRRRGAGGIRPRRRRPLGLSAPGRDARYRHSGQTDGQRPSPGGGGHDPCHRRALRQRHGVLQLLRRQSRVLRRRHGGAGRDRAGRPAAAGLRDRQLPAGAFPRHAGAPRSDRRRARPRHVSGHRTGARPRNVGARDIGSRRRDQHPQGSRRAALHRRAVRQRAQAQAADRLRPRGSRHPLRRAGIGAGAGRQHAAVKDSAISIAKW